MKKLILLLFVALKAQAQTPCNFPLVSADTGTFTCASVLATDEIIFVEPANVSHPNWGLMKIKNSLLGVLDIDTITSGTAPAVDPAGNIAYCQGGQIAIIFSDGSTASFVSSQVPVTLASDTLGNVILGTVGATGSMLYYYNYQHTFIWQKSVSAKNIEHVFIASGWVVAIYDNGDLEKRNTLDGGLNGLSNVGAGYTPGAAMLLANGKILMSLNSVFDSLSVVTLTPGVLQMNFPSTKLHSLAQITHFREIGSAVFAVGVSDDPSVDSSLVAWQLGAAGSSVVSSYINTNTIPEFPAGILSSGQMVAMQFSSSNVNLLTYGFPNPAGIWEHTKPSIAVFPNPTRDNWNISSQVSKPWELYDANGKLVGRGEGKQIPGELLKPGMYLLSFGDSRQVVLKE